MALFKSNIQKIDEALKEANAELAIARRDMQTAAYDAALSDNPAAAQPAIDRVDEISRKIALLEIAQNEAHRQERESGIAKTVSVHRSWASKLRHELDEVQRFQTRTANAVGTSVKNWLGLVEHANAAIELLSLSPELTSMENPAMEWLDPDRLRDDLMIEAYRLSGGPGAAFPFVSHKDAIHHGVNVDNGGQIEPIGRVLRDQIGVIERVMDQIGADIAAGKRGATDELVADVRRSVADITPTPVEAPTVPSADYSASQRYLEELAANASV